MHSKSTQESRRSSNITLLNESKHKAIKERKRILTDIIESKDEITKYFDKLSKVQNEFKSDFEIQRNIKKQKKALVGKIKLRNSRISTAKNSQLECFDSDCENLEVNGQRTSRKMTAEIEYLEDFDRSKKLRLNFSPKVERTILGELDHKKRPVFGSRMDRDSSPEEDLVGYGLPRVSLASEQPAQIMESFQSNDCLKNLIRQTTRYSEMNSCQEDHGALSEGVGGVEKDEDEEPTPQKLKCKRAEKVDLSKQNSRRSGFEMAGKLSFDRESTALIASPVVEPISPHIEDPEQQVGEGDQSAQVMVMTSRPFKPRRFNPRRAYRNETELRKTAYTRFLRGDSKGSLISNNTNRNNNFATNNTQLTQEDPRDLENKESSNRGRIEPPRPRLDTQDKTGPDAKANPYIKTPGHRQGSKKNSERKTSRGRQNRRSRGTSSNKNGRASRGGSSGPSIIDFQLSDSTPLSSRNSAKNSIQQSKYEREWELEKERQRERLRREEEALRRQQERLKEIEMEEEKLKAIEQRQAHERRMRLEMEASWRERDQETSNLKKKAERKLRIRKQLEQELRRKKDREEDQSVTEVSQSHHNTRCSVYSSKSSIHKKYKKEAKKDVSCYTRSRKSHKKRSPLKKSVNKIRKSTSRKSKRFRKKKKRQSSKILSSSVEYLNSGSKVPELPLSQLKFSQHHIDFGSLENNFTFDQNHNVCEDLTTAGKQSLEPMSTKRSQRCVRDTHDSREYQRLGNRSYMTQAQTSRSKEGYLRYIEDGLMDVRCQTARNTVGGGGGILSSRDEFHALTNTARSRRTKGSSRSGNRYQRLSEGRRPEVSDRELNIVKKRNCKRLPENQEFLRKQQKVREARERIKKRRQYSRVRN